MIIKIELQGTKATAIMESKKVGWLKIVARPEYNYYKIEIFHVIENDIEKYRHTGIGRKLLNEIIKEISKTEGTKLIVYPNPESYPDEPSINIRDLYEIYEHLGFFLENPEADRNKPNNKMILTIPI